MSLATWKSEFYPVEADSPEATATDLSAAEHSLRKWRGTLPEALKHHEVTFERQTVGGAEAGGIYFSDDSCALCQKFKKPNVVESAKRCGSCPLYQIRGESCDRVAKGEIESPYKAALHNTAPMIAVLERTVGYVQGRVAGQGIVGKSFDIHPKIDTQDGVDDPVAAAYGGKVPVIPAGWRQVEFRKPRFGEWFLERSKRVPEKMFVPELHTPRLILAPDNVYGKPLDEVAVPKGYRRVPEESFREPTNADYFLGMYALEMGAGVIKPGEKCILSLDRRRIIIEPVPRVTKTYWAVVEADGSARLVQTKPTPTDQSFAITKVEIDVAEGEGL